MVQVLPYVPSFGEKLASSFGQAAGSVGSAYFQGRRKEKARERTKQFENQTNTPLNNFTNAAEESTRQFKPLDIADVYQDYVEAYGEDVAELKGKEFIENKQHARDRAEKLEDEARKKADELAKEEQENEGIRNSVEFLEQNIEHTGSKNVPFTKSYGASILNPFESARESAQIREEFTKTGQQLSDIAYSRVNKGAQSEAKLQLWRDEWSPNSELPERINIARINSLKRFLNLPEKISKSETKKIEAQEKRKVKEAAKTLNVYDSSGKLIGTIDENQQSELPEGYEAR